MERFAHAGLRFEVTDMPPADGGAGQVAMLLHGFPCQLPWLPELALSRRDGGAMRAALVRTGLDPDSAARYAARAADPAAMRGPLNWYRGRLCRRRWPVTGIPTLRSSAWRWQPPGGRGRGSGGCLPRPVLRGSL
jgi:hypothetical protein